MTLSRSSSILDSAISIDMTDKNTGRTLTLEVPASTLVAALQKENTAARDSACDQICRSFGVQLQQIYGEDPQLLTWSDIVGSITADLSLRQLPLDLPGAKLPEDLPCLFDYAPLPAG